jgi:hypothetical protein
VAATLAETIVKLEINEAFLKLKAMLVEKGCRVIAEEPPKNLTVQQGSLWGATPKTAQKTIKYKLSASGSETRITSHSTLSKGYVNLTVVGCVFAVALILLCVWMSFDLAAFAASQKQSFWSWIVTAKGYAGTQSALWLSATTQVFAYFLVAVIALEVVIVVYAHYKIGGFAEEILKLLQKNQANK